MTFEKIRQIVADVPYTPPEDGRLIYDHVLKTRPRKVLELGFAHGVASMYIAAALDEIGAGELHTVDLLSEKDSRNPSIEQLAAAAGLEKYIKVYREHTSYTWFLKKQIEKQTKDHACVPMYDFAFIDGPKNWTIDGMAFFCVDKLLNQNGWILFDDMDWYYGSYRHETLDGITIRNMSEEEMMTPQIGVLFDLVVKQHPSYSNFIIMDNGFGWAQKIASDSKQVQFRTNKSLWFTARKVLKSLVGRKKSNLHANTNANANSNANVNRNVNVNANSNANARTT
jgi:predicted O-methyltransferase YrrM